MLVLTRKSQEAVVIGGSSGERLLKVTVLEIRGRNVKLGFEAAAEVPVHRWEVWERIHGGHSDCAAGPTEEFDIP